MIFGLAWASAQGQIRDPLPGSRAPVLSQRASAPLRLGAGDLIDVEVFNTPELSAPKVRVSEGGSIKLPVAGAISVAGLTAYEASDVIERDLRESSIMLDPHVTVLITEYATQGVRVLGQVKNPGTYILLGQHTVYDAIAAAGGVDTQEGSTITVTHQGDPEHPQVISINSANYSEAEQATPIGPGDLVVVSRADGVFVLGDVVHPGEFFIDNGKPLTILQAVALAQGLNRTALGSKASILRKTSDGAVTIPLNIKEIEHNRQPNVALQAADILIIPHSEAKQFLISVLPYATGSFIGTAVGVAIAR